jgi:glyoxylase-like metal-dependent hydrolase (beta-lactamase superfamily II)
MSFESLVLSQKAVSKPALSTWAIAMLVATTALAGCSRQSEQPAPTADAAQQSAPPASPAATPDSENVKSFTIGEFPAYALRDGGLDFPNDGKTFAIGHKPEEVAALLTAAGLPTDKLALSIQPLLVKAGDRVLLFDTGAGSSFGPSAGSLPASLAAAGVDPGSITDIFISHVHGDHTGGFLNAEGQLVFTNATIHLSAPEWAYLTKMTPDAAASVGLPKHAALVAALTPKVAPFAPGSELIPGVVKAMEIKGHTPGHSGYLITSGQSSLLYIGDAMHHSIVSVQKPDWPINFDSDAKAAETSRDALLKAAAADGQRIYAVHFPFPGLGKIESRGDGYVWVAE